MVIGNTFHYSQSPASVVTGKKPRTTTPGRVTQQPRSDKQFVIELFQRASGRASIAEGSS